MTTEVVRRIWDDTEGVCFEVRPDQDGLGMIEVHTPDKKSKEYYGNIRFTAPKETAIAIAYAILACANEIKE